MKKRKALKIALLSLLGLVIAVIAVLCIRYKGITNMVFNWDNIVSFVNSQRYSAKQLEGKMEANKNKIEEITKKDPNIEIRGDLTEDEAQALSDGKITKEEAISIVKGDTTLEEVLSSKEVNKEPKSDANTAGKPISSEQTPPRKEPPKEEEPPAPKDRASEIIAELYVIQADFIKQLEAIGDKAYADYKAIYYKRDQIPAIIDSYTGEVTALELNCDRTVNDLLKQLEAELTKVGGDLNTVKEIKKYYYKEKSLKKSYYLNKMNDEDYK